MIWSARQNGLALTIISLSLIHIYQATETAAIQLVDQLTAYNSFSDCEVTLSEFSKETNAVFWVEDQNGSVIYPAGISTETEIISEMCIRDRLGALSSYLCDPATAPAEFLLVKSQYQAETGRAVERGACLLYTSRCV